MNCDDCLEWMKSRTLRGMPENPKVLAHLRSCPACRRIFALDACLEAGIQHAFTPYHLPAGLAEDIDACVDRYADVSQKPEPPGRDPVPPSAETNVPGTRKITLKKTRIGKYGFPKQHRY